MRLIIAIAAGLLATGAAAQTTTVTRTVERTHTDMRNNGGRHHATMHRTCRTQWRHHRRVRICRMTRW